MKGNNMNAKQISEKMIEIEEDAQIIQETDFLSEATKAGMLDRLNAEYSKYEARAIELARRLV